MKVIVIGATGSIGALAVRSMLEQGHAVTAFARRPDALDLSHPNLRRLSGDAMDAGAVHGAIKGHDAVVVAVGSGPFGALVRSRATLNVIQAMQVLGIRRLICQSTLGAHESWSNLNFYWKRIMFGLVLRRIYKDHLTQEDMVRASGLDWTIVRPSAFTDDQPSGDLRVAFPSSERGLSLKIARKEVADFLTTQLADPGYMHRAVGISH